MDVDKDIEIEVIADDDSLKILGELLANKTSRDLMKFLMNKSTYKMKISDELGVPFSLVEHHLKKLEKLGLVKITNKKLIKGGILHKTYKITADAIFLMLNTTKEEIKEKGILKRIFKDSVKFAAVGIAGIASWFGTQQYTPVILNRGVTSNFETGDILIPANTIPQVSMEPIFSFIPIIVTGVVVFSCLFLIWYTKK